MAYLTKKDIDNAVDRRTEDFEVPEWGGTVRLMVMSGTDLDRFEAILVDPDKQKEGGVRAQLVGKCMVDEDGKRLFSDAEVYQLGKKSGAALTKVFQKCIEMNRINPDKDEVDIENFESDQSESSTTG